MKLSRLILLLSAACAWLTSSVGHAAVEIWPVTDLVGAPVPFTQTILGSPSAPNNNNAGGYTLTNLTYKFSTDSNGVVTYTNLFPGTYIAGVQLLQGWTYVQFTITNFNSTNYVTNNSTVGSVSQGLSNSYSMLASDARYPSIAGSNIVFTTTNGQLVVNASGGGSTNGITNNQTGVTLSGTFNGNGAGLTNLSIAAFQGNMVPSGADYSNGSDDMTQNGQAGGGGTYKVTGVAGGIYSPTCGANEQYVGVEFYCTSTSTPGYQYTVGTNLYGSLDSSLPWFKNGCVFTNSGMVSNQFYFVGITASTAVTATVVQGASNTIAATTINVGTLNGNLGLGVTIASSNVTAGLLSTDQLDLESGLAVLGTGTLSTAVGSHLWTNSSASGFNANHQWEFFFATNQGQHQFFWLNSQVAYSGDTAQSNLTTAAWFYYPNALRINNYPAGLPPKYQATVDSDGGYHIQGEDTVNDGGITIGGGTNAFKFYIATSPNRLSIQNQGVNGTGNQLTFFSATIGAPAGLFAMTTNGVSINNPNAVMATSNVFEVATTAGTNYFSVGTNGEANSQYLNASTALVSDANKGIVSSSTTSNEIGYVHGVTSAIQTQLNTLQSGSTALTNLANGNAASLTNYPINSLGNALAYSGGTNIYVSGTGMTNYGQWSGSITLTNSTNTYFAIPSNGATGYSFIVSVTQDATGTRTVTFADSSSNGWHTPGSNVFTFTTNANAVSYISCVWRNPTNVDMVQTLNLQ